MPAGDPDIRSVVQASALELAGDGGQALEGSLGSPEPEGGGDGRQSKGSGQHSPKVVAPEQYGAARQRHHCGNEPSARGGEEDRNQAQRQIAQRQQAPRPARFAVQQQSCQRKAQVEIAGHIVGILPLGNEANLAGGDGLRRAEASQGERDQHPRAGHIGAQQRTQIAGALGKLPDQPDDHQLLRVAAQLVEGRQRVDGPEIGAAEP